MVVTVAIPRTTATTTTTTMTTMTMTATTTTMATIMATTTTIASVTAMTMAMAMRMARMADRDVQKLKTHAKKPQTFFREGRAGIHSNVSNRRAGGSV